MNPGTAHLSVQGMTCGGCARSVQKKLEATPGVRKADVNLQGAIATVEYDADAVQPDALAAAVCSIGFEASAQA